MSRYTVIESKSWLRDDGATASIYGSVPYSSDAEKARWKVVTRGWTVRDDVNGTVGIGKKPWNTKSEADAWAKEKNKDYDDRQAACRAGRQATRPVTRGRARGKSGSKSKSKLDADIARLTGKKL